MAIRDRQLENGDWEATGYGDIRGIGKTREEAMEDFLRKVGETLAEFKRAHGFSLYVV